MRAHEFYERHGGKALIIARFMPVVRTFAPVVGGMATMNYPRFVDLHDHRRRGVGHGHDLARLFPRRPDSRRGQVPRVHRHRHHHRVRRAARSSTSCAIVKKRPSRAHTRRPEADKARPHLRLRDNFLRLSTNTYAQRTQNDRPAGKPHGLAGGDRLLPRRHERDAPVLRPRRRDEHRRLLVLGRCRAAHGRRPRGHRSSGARALPAGRRSGHRRAPAHAARGHHR